MLVIVLNTVATSSAKSGLVELAIATLVVAVTSSLDAVTFVISTMVLVCVVSTTAVKYTELGEPPPIVMGSIAGSMITVAG